MTRLALLLAATLAQPAAALSCLPPDPVTLYQIARDSADRFMVVRGELMPKGRVRLPNKGKPAETSARIEGSILTADGFAPGFARDATLRLTCAGEWCANAPEPVEVFMAVKIEGARLVVEQGPCFGNLIPASDADADRVLTCHRGGDCSVDF